jgi:hypothetical protein
LSANAARWARHRVFVADRNHNQLRAFDAATGREVR